jgi:tRNA-specific 2-thiouridylase
MKRVIVAMSGGVDSSVAAALLLEQGYDVIGVTLRMHECRAGASDRSRPCCGPGDRQDAEHVAKDLGIQHVMLDARKEFAMQVRGPAVKSYLSGKTPNPCIPCNHHIKFRFLLGHAPSLQADFVATGHHARIGLSSDGSLSLYRGCDREKDQSYVLFPLVDDDLLGKLLFPVGKLTKETVRQKAGDLRLPVADKEESQDLCFLPWGEDMPGLIKNKHGDILGEHRGISRFTIGQRRGIGVAQGERRYVLGTKSDENVVVVGTEDELYSSRAEVSDLSWAEGRLEEVTSVDAQIRYGHHAVPATVRPEANGAVVIFQTPQRAVTPGQALVCYQEDRVLGGGWIVGPSLVE